MKRKGNKELAYMSLSLKSFVKYLQTEQSEDHYRRATFKLFDEKDLEIGQLELSVSFIRARRDPKIILEEQSSSEKPQDIQASFFNSQKRTALTNIRHTSI